jgi:hypothetical protein
MSEDIESAQKNQKKIGAAEENPETSGPAENSQPIILKLSAA